MSSPASLLLIHGAGSGPWIFVHWHPCFRHVVTDAIDLQESLDMERATMEDYTSAVAASARRLPQPVSLCGWSMGGLVALQAESRVRPHSLVLIEPTLPGEIQGFDPGVELLTGTYNPERVYGRFPAGYRARRESSRARAERKRGISVPAISCPTLVVYGCEFSEDRGRKVASYSVPQASPSSLRRVCVPGSTGSGRWTDWLFRAGPVGRSCRGRLSHCRWRHDFRERVRFLLELVPDDPQ